MSMIRPACHARGLISFCKSNPALRIEHNIGLLRNLLPRAADWGIDDHSILGSNCLEAMVPWIEGTSSLAASGMPLNAYRLIIDGSTTEAAQAFRIMKYAAAMQEAMLTQAERNSMQPTSWVRLPYGESISLPWHLPTGFPNAIRGIMNGTSNIRFTGPVGDPWDTDHMFLERKDWTEEEWHNEWEEKIGFSAVDSTFYKDVKAWYEL